MLKFLISNIENILKIQTSIAYVVLKKEQEKPFKSQEKFDSIILIKRSIW